MEKEEKQERKSSNVNISEPMFFWIFLLVMAIILNTLLTYTPAASNISQYAILGKIADFILSAPGLLILPLIAGAVIGAEVGLRTKNIKSAAKVGFLNGIYGSVIYIISIIILFEVITYVLPKAGLTLSYFIGNWVIIPIIAFIIVIEAFAALSNSRKTNN